ncbi:MAG: hypothetical protein IAF08_15920, partial [Rhizobacter sp.]|nr:hypothetical protein [Chlorobiales bacterium]
MKKVFLAALLSLPSFSSVQSSLAQTTVVLSKGDVAEGVSSKSAATVSPDSLLKHIKFLASDRLEGRGSGEPGNNLAALYIAEHFKSLDLKSFSTAQTGESYFQKFEITTGLRAGTGNSLTLGKKKFTSPETLVPLGISASAGVKSEDVVFVGYGITTKDG